MHLITIFVSIGSKLASHQTPTTLNPLNSLQFNANSVVIHHIEENEVVRIINSLNNSSPGWDCIPAKLAKRVLNYSINNYIIIIFILYSMLECVHIRDQIIRSIWYYFYIYIHLIDSSTIYTIHYALSPYYYLVYHVYNYRYVCLMYYVILITTSFMSNE